KSVDQKAIALHIAKSFDSSAFLLKLLSKKAAELGALIKWRKQHRSHLKTFFKKVNAGGKSIPALIALPNKQQSALFQPIACSHLDCRFGDSKPRLTHEFASVRAFSYSPLFETRHFLCSNNW